MEPQRGSSWYNGSLLFRSFLDFVLMIIFYFLLQVIGAGVAHDFSVPGSGDVNIFLMIAAILFVIVLFTNGVQRAGARDYSTATGIGDGGTFFDGGMPGLRRVGVQLQS